MMLEAFLSASDAGRAERTLRNLVRNDLLRFALTGGFAIELQITARGGQPMVRPLNDIDFLIECFDGIPESLGDDLLVRHAHPDDPPGKMLLQGVDPETSVRVDVFRAYGNEMGRVEAVELGGFPLTVVCFEDLLTRHARLCWDLVEGKPLAPKYARDFLRILEVVRDTAPLESVWIEHRKPGFASTFAAAVARIEQALAERGDLLVEPTYSRDVGEVCARCAGAAAFPLASAEKILARLGYC